jgi:uncharacterized protein YjdB
MKKIFQTTVYVLMTILVVHFSCCKEDTEIPISKIDLSKTTLSIAAGAGERLYATVYPEDATDKRIRWHSEDISVATVDQNGFVQGVSAGITVIRISNMYDKTYLRPESSCAVSVHEEPVLVTGVSLGKTATTISMNDAEELNYIVVPANATNKNVTWKSNNTSIVTVDGNGKITGIAIGRATVTVTSEDGQFKSSCVVTVQNEAIPVTGFTLNKTTLDIYLDDVEELTAEISPANATDKTVTWSSSNTSVVTVDGGKITGVSTGTATVVATCANGGFTSTCTVTVKSEMGNLTSTGWSDPAEYSYEYSMTYVAQVAFRGSVSTDTGVEVAAYVGDNLRGYAKLIYESDLDMYLIHLTVYSNSAGGEQVSLKAYNPQKKRIYENCKEFSFHGNTSLGSASEILDCNP